MYRINITPTATTCLVPSTTTSCAIPPPPSKLHTLDLQTTLSSFSSTLLDVPPLFSTEDVNFMDDIFFADPFDPFIIDSTGLISVTASIVDSPTTNHQKTKGKASSSSSSNKVVRHRSACQFPSCTNVARGPRGSQWCKKHGGGKRCTEPECTRASQRFGRCSTHGGKTTCMFFQCTKYSQSYGLCKGHGGGTRCSAYGCFKNAHQHRLCRTHGGGPKCTYIGCTKWADSTGMCRSHALKSAVVVEPETVQHGLTLDSTGQVCEQREATALAQIKK